MYDIAETNWNLLPDEKGRPAVRAAWIRWRKILSRIIGHPNYRYGAPNVATLNRLAQFASNELAHFNDLYWR